MITREEYNKALDIVEAYHKQIGGHEIKRKIKDLREAKVGDIVRPTKVISHCRHLLTLGKEYTIIDVRHGHNWKSPYFTIVSDTGESRDYQGKSKHFELLA